MSIFGKALPQKGLNLLDTRHREINERFLGASKLSEAECFVKWKTGPRGLSSNEARKRLKKYGKNEVVKEKSNPWYLILARNFRDPLTILLIVLAAISFLTSDIKATAIIASMVTLSVLLRFVQELKADKAAKKLRALVHTTARVIRNGKPKDLPLSQLVPGDIIHLSAGDMVPADVRLLQSKDLFVNQASLTGESMPAEKHATLLKKCTESGLECENLCFLGTNVENGTAEAVVISTGRYTYFGAMAQSIIFTELPTNFDVGIKKFTWLMIKFILVMVPAVFFINWVSKGGWFEAFLFSLAVAVGLAPEMLPVIVTANLSKGAINMSRKKVIVKHLDAIQNFGAMDILCTDKTGTLTQGKVILEKYININGDEDMNILKFAYLNSYFQTGLNNLLDAAVLKHTEWSKKLNIDKGFKKMDEIPWDFTRRRMSVVIQEDDQSHVLICKGAVEEIVHKCKTAEVFGKITPLLEAEHRAKIDIEKDLNSDGFRVVAVAYKKVPEKKKRYTAKDETDLTLLGFLAFLDPPKETAGEAIKLLEKYGVSVKILTGDNEIVTRKICEEVGLKNMKIVTGREIEKMKEDELRQVSEQVSIFAKLTPLHKERIITVLRAQGHAVGYLGDGINDAPALRAADVGISVDTAVDIAKESSDIILLEKDLSVLKEGALEGRKIFANIVKYIQMAASSNFGNMFSVVGASIFLPFLPMLPIQILTNNLLYDFSQTAIPTDRVDEEDLRRPRKWRIDHIRRFILYIGPISSIYDYATYFIMLYVFNSWGNPALFHTGWFVESLCSQTLIIHIIRTNKIPFFQSRASWPLTFATLAIISIGIYLPFSPLAAEFGFVSLPPLYFVLLFFMIITYFILTQMMKVYFIKKYKNE